MTKDLLLVRWGVSSSHGYLSTELMYCFILPVENNVAIIFFVNASQSI